MWQFLWGVAQYLVAGASLVLGVYVLWTIIMIFVRLAKWEMLPHTTKGEYLFDAVRAAFKRVGMRVEMNYADDIELHPKLEKLVVAANVWMRVHGWPSQFTKKSFPVVFAHLKVEMESPAYRLSTAIGNVFAPPTARQSEPATEQSDAVNA